MNFEQIPIGPVCPVRPSVRPPVRPSVRPSGSVLVRPGPSGSVRSVRSVRVRPDGLMMLITYVIHRAIDYHRSNRTRPARPARPGPSCPSGSVRARLARWVGLSNRGLLQSMPTLQIPQYTLCAVIHWGTSNTSTNLNVYSGKNSKQKSHFYGRAAAQECLGNFYGPCFRVFAVYTFEVVLVYSK